MWNDLNSIAIVGTERKPIPDTMLHALQKLGIATQGASPTEVVLKGLATHHLLRKASGNLLKDVEYKPVPPSPISAALRQCPSFAAGIIHKILTIPDFHEAMLPEIMRLLWQQKVAFPSEYIPLLLEKCYRDAGFMAVVSNYLDEQVIWVASLQPRWACLLPTDMNDWQTSAFPERQKLLQQGLRRLPEAARAALQASWATEKTDHKVRFLDILADTITAADAYLLETALDDPQQTVRSTAAKYLRLLPGNTLTAKAEAFFELHYAPFFKGKGSDLLGVALSDENAPDIQYFMSFLDKYRKIDWRWNVFLQVMAALSPLQWTQLTGMPLAAIIKRVRKIEQFNAAPFVTMAADLAAVHSSAELGKALLEECADLLYHQEHHLWCNEVMGKLLVAMPKQEWEEMMGYCLAKNYSFAWKALAERPGMLSNNLVTPALLYLKAQSQQMQYLPRSGNQLLTLLLQKVAYFANALVASEAIGTMEEALLGDIPDFVREMSGVLGLRKEIAHALGG